MSEPTEIRRLTYADLPQVIAIERRAFTTPWSLAMFVLELSKASGICLAATRGERLVAYLICSRYDTIWHVMNVAVDDRLRREGLATARALAAAHRLELRPVSSLAALAAGIAAPLCLPLIDAGRGEVFAALYEDGRELWPPFAATADAVAGRVRDARLAPLGAGSGSVRWADVLEAGGVSIVPADQQANVPSAVAICRLALGTPAAPAEAVLPQYLREPDVQAP